MLGARRHYGQAVTPQPHYLGDGPSQLLGCGVTVQGQEASGPQRFLMAVAGGGQEGFLVLVVEEKDL